MGKRIIDAFLCLTFFFLSSSQGFSTPVLVDRLLLEISGKSYSQKQLEVYTLLRTIAMGEPARSGLPSGEKWSEQLENFKNEMVIVTQLENDQTKLDSFLPDTKTLTDGEQALNTAQSKDAEVDAFIRQRGLTDSDMSKLLTMIFRVEGYTRSRLQLTQTRSADDKGPNFIKLDPSAEWFQALLKATAYRFYAQAKVYKPLASLR